MEETLALGSIGQHVLKDVLISFRIGQNYRTSLSKGKVLNLQIIEQFQLSVRSFLLLFNFTHLLLSLSMKLLVVDSNRE